MTSVRHLRGKFVGKGEWHNLVNTFCKLQSQNVFYFILYYHLFYTYGKAVDKPRVDDVQNPVFMGEKILKPIFHPVKFVYALFPVYRQNKVGVQNTPYLLYTQEFLKCSNKKRLIWGWVILVIPILCCL